MCGVYFLICNEIRVSDLDIVEALFYCSVSWQYECTPTYYNALNLATNILIRICQYLLH
jgi:hypothetical protein